MTNMSTPTPVYAANIEQAEAGLHAEDKVFGLVKYTLYDAPMKVKPVAYKPLCRPLIKYDCEAWDPYTKN